MALLTTPSTAEGTWYYVMNPSWFKSIQNGTLSKQVGKTCAPDDWDPEAQKDFIPQPGKIHRENRAELYAELLGSNACDVVVVSEEMYSIAAKSGLKFYQETTIRRP